jgi:ubiquinone biosynthesis protein COQ9
LGLPDSVADLHTFIESPQIVFERAESMLAAPEAERTKVREAVEKAIETNLSILKTLLASYA